MTINNHIHGETEFSFRLSQKAGYGALLCQKPVDFS